MRTPGGRGRPGGGHKKRMEHAGCTRGLSNAIIPNRAFLMCVGVAIEPRAGFRHVSQFCRRRGRSVWAHSAQRMAASPRTGARAIRPGGVRSCTVRVVGTAPDPGRRTRAPGSHPVTRPCTSPRAEAQASHTPWDPSAGTSLQCALCIVSSGGLPSVRVDTHIVHARPHFHHLISRWSRRRSPR